MDSKFGENFFYKNLPRKSFFIVSWKLIIGHSVFEIASAIVRANVVRIRCSPQPVVLTPTELLPFSAHVPHPHTPA